MNNTQLNSKQTNIIEHREDKEIQQLKHNESEMLSAHFFFVRGICKTEKLWPVLAEQKMHLEERGR